MENVRFDFVTIFNNALKQNIVNATDKDKIYSIFCASDTEDADGKLYESGDLHDGELNSNEQISFVDKLRECLPLKQLEQIKFMLQGMNLAKNAPKISRPYTAQTDALYVEKPDIIEVAELKTDNFKAKPLSQQEKTIAAKRLMNKYKKIWKNSNLGLDFYEKLFDVIPKLNLKVDNFDSDHFYSVEEQIADRLLLLFANEAKLNSKTTANGVYGGLFQLSNDTIPDIKQWAKVNPDRISESKLNTNFKNPTQFAQNVSAVEQLDWLISFAGCKGVLDQDKTVDELAQVIKAARSIGRVTQTLDKTQSRNKVPYGTRLT